MRRVLLAVVLVGVVFAGCSSDDDHDDHDATASAAGSTPTSAGEDDHGHETTTTAFAASAATSTVKLRMRDYVFVDVPATMTGPRVAFEAVNDGPGQHEARILDEGGAEKGVIAPLAKGVRATMALELPAGTYTMECLIKEGAKTHAELGMRSTFVVEA